MHYESNVSVLESDLTALCQYVCTVPTEYNAVDPVQLEAYAHLV